MTAVIDGQPWAAAGPGPAGCRLEALVSAGVSVAVCGTDGVYQIGMAMPAAVGTHQLGVGSSGVPSAFLIDLTDPTNLRTWGPTRNQGSGQIVISSISATSVTGTFEFTAPPLAPPASGTRTVTNGQFNLPVCTNC
jgi:hypothetical protein